MAPPAKRRKRAIVDDDSDDDDSQKHNNNNNNNNNNGSQNFLKRFLSSPSKASPSPDKKPATATTQPASASPSPSPIRKRPATRATRSKPVRSPSTSPLKPRTRASAAALDAKDAAGSADLRTLFSRQAERNSQSQSAVSSAPSLSFSTSARAGGGSSFQLSARGSSRSQLDEIISDPISEKNGGDDDDDDDVPLMYSASSTAASSFAERAKAAQKRLAGNDKAGGNGASSRGGCGSTGFAAAAGGHRFLRAKQATPFSKAPTPLPNDDSRPWSERFAPASLDELAVHKRKVADVRGWLEEVFAGRTRQRLLVLKGPAGAGKTTTVRLLARDMRCEVLEWRNPGSSFGVPGQAYQSAATQFEEFLGRGGKFGQLDLEEEEGEEEDEDGDTPPPPAPGGKRLMLVEEFPNTFMRSSAGLMGFRDAVIQFLSASVPPMGLGSAPEPGTPVVMVISETLLTTTSASADSFTAHRLLGPEILKHPGTAVIEFKPIAPTFLIKALELVVQKEARKSGRRRTPGPRVLQRLGEVGDIRNAISSLEFLCAKGDAEADWGGKVAFTKPKRASKDAAPALTKGEQESLELVSRREATLGIFHAVGKVVYNKRTDFPPGSVEATAEAALPDCLSRCARPKKSEVAVDALIDEIGTDTHTFISALHENYPLSCEQTGPSDPNSCMDYINGCLDYLSDSDLLYPSWDVFFGGGRGTHAYGGAVSLGGYSGKDSGGHMLRQDEMAFQVAVRGMLFSLPTPVRRQAHPNGRGADAYKMFYPTYLKLWRSKEELEALVDLWAAKLLKGEECGPGPPAPTQKQGFFANGAAAFRKPAGAAAGRIDGFVAAAPATPPGAGGIQPPAASQKPARGSAPPPLPLLSLGSAARKELLLERLPYTAHIARGRRQYAFFGGSLRMRDLDQMVAFRGIGALGAGEDDASEDGTEAPAGGAPRESEWATDRPVAAEDGVGIGIGTGGRRKGGLGVLLSGRGKKGGEEDEGLLPLQGLVISDDDIEDDG
ncbi:hypothetical protein VTJ83DRAFT_5953 [Remersonia thermophila]|uniref:Checkpoint protein RAD24-like helical bundle domain-containing protein n=1 Tax=Remersonia thermophila TaxID=72144 RepID=A0ABR4D9X2_9PEZI